MDANKRKISSSLKNKIIDICKKEKNILTVYIFGSYGTNYQRKDSDLDLAILFDESPEVMRQMELAGKFELKLGIEVDLINLNKADIILKHDVITKGEKIYSQDDIRTADFKEYVFKYGPDAKISKKKIRKNYIAGLKEELK